ncbi:MFS transporter [Nocardioides sp. B-3]|uniref:MFS transporter n=1 Tax=Nocardioides sp. B-3 TaxID=2895565 RepID=UPI002152871F|nr:MFS transporter [Nocardioides sp. B-3]UUZ58226.1 MFS transporter [Nocardioides sp. B-3]
MFGIASYTAALTYILAFGLAKAATNYLAGTWSERFGRKPVLIGGWLIALPVPLLLIWAPRWWVVIAANVLLGISRGLTRSTTVIMKIDPVGSEKRGLALGLNESAGYLAVAVTALVTGQIAARAGLRPEPFPGRSRLCSTGARAVHVRGEGDPRTRSRRGAGARRGR